MIFNLRNKIKKKLCINKTHHEGERVLNCVCKTQNFKFNVFIYSSFRLSFSIVFLIAKNKFKKKNTFCNKKEKPHTTLIQQTKPTN